MHVNKVGLDFFVKVRLCLGGIMLPTDERATAEAEAVFLSEELEKEERTSMLSSCF